MKAAASFDLADRLIEHGIKPSAQRVVVAQYALTTDEHPSADQVWTRVRRNFPFISRATVYNTLNLFVKKGLLQALVLAEGKIVFDPKTDPHHHFVDDQTGGIHDVPWEALEVKQIQNLRDYDVRAYQVVLRGRRRGNLRRG